MYLEKTIIHMLWSDSTGVRYHQNHREIKYYMIHSTKYWSSQKSTCKNGPVAVHTCQACPTANSNGVEKRNWLVLVPSTRWRTNLKIIFVSNRPYERYPSLKVPQSPLYPFCSVVDAAKSLLFTLGSVIFNGVVLLIFVKKYSWCWEACLILFLVKAFKNEQ